MKLQNQVLLILGTLAAVAVIRHGYHLEHKRAHIDEITESEVLDVRSQGKTLPAAQDASSPETQARGTAAAPVHRASASALPLESLNMNAIEDPGTRQALSKAVSYQKNEKDFLLHKVGLTPAQYQKIEEHRKEIYRELHDAEAWAKAFGANVDEVKKPILAKHARWMQNTIGVGNYYTLQQISAAQIR